MSIPANDRLITSLRERGQRVTPQRLAIAAAVRDMNRHVSAEQVHAEVGRRVPGVSLPTVYATLDLLEELNLVRRVASDTGVAVYDPRTDQHHHLICRRCAAIIDVEGAIDDGALRAAATRAGFAADEAQVIIRGLCAQCAAQAAD